MFSPFQHAATQFVLDYIDATQSVEVLDKFWGSLDQSYKDDPVVSAAYTARKSELTDEGKLEKEHRVLGFLGTQTANAIWAVTEKALPKILDWLDEFKDAYNIRTEELEAMKDLAKSGEFGLNAVVRFMLWATLFPSVRANATPYWTEWQQNAWAKHPINIPSVSELVRMEYREVFRPEYRKELIEDEPISSDFEGYMATQGYSKTWAENYWGAHWDLPSISQGYEMFHRLRPSIQIDANGNIVSSGGKYHIPSTYSKPFTLDDLNGLLKRQDVLKRYRDQLVEIAYKPYTRVDVRRMYRAGVLDFEDVIGAYLDLGYDPKRALKMAEFTRSWVEEGVEKRETRGGILDALKVGVITPAEAESELATFYPDDVAKRYVEVAKIKNKPTNELNKGDVGWLFKHGEMPETEARQRFSKMGYPDDDVDYLIIRYSPD